MKTQISKSLLSIFKRSKNLSDYVEALKNGDALNANEILDKLKDINIRCGYNDTDASDGVLDEMGMNPLHFAVFHNKPLCVSHCLLRNMSLNALCWQGSPLQMAIFQVHSEIATILLDAGADPKVLSNSGRTLIFDTAVNDMHEITARLITEFDVNVNKIDDFGGSALDRCIDKNKPEAARLLRAHGANYSDANYQAIAMGLIDL